MERMKRFMSGEQGYRQARSMSNMSNQQPVVHHAFEEEDEEELMEGQQQSDHQEGGHGGSGEFTENYGLAAHGPEDDDGDVDTQEFKKMDIRTDTSIVPQLGSGTNHRLVGGLCFLGLVFVLMAVGLSHHTHRHMKVQVPGTPKRTYDPYDEEWGSIADAVGSSYDETSDDSTIANKMNYGGEGEFDFLQDKDFSSVYNFTSADISKNGIICLRNTYGRLNNQVISFRGGLVFAYLLNRTFVAPKTVGKLYDLGRMSRIPIQGYDLENAPHKLVVPYDPELCGPSPMSKTIAKYCDKKREGCNLMDNELVDKLFRASAQFPGVAISGYALYRNAKWANMVGNLEQNFYRYLYPKQFIDRKVREYIDSTFPDQMFSAVHLRWLEGSCLYRVKLYNKGVGQMLCSPKRQTMLEVMQDQISRTDLPIFVASDHQRLDVLKTYSGDYMYKGECKGFVCAVIDFEIAARSNFFVGVVVSTASDTVAKLRRYRPLRHVGTYYHSVLSWKPPGKDGTSSVDVSEVVDQAIGHP